ncbi:MAG: hypothetical protein VR73_09495 [Gammaproteobacteria bacterium BRH_c0]|nr:MAG: hypothetical protein VR73_09495 [Gammaproteobacteria bacterium BRH_c0]
MSHWLYLGFRVYERSGKFAPVLGPGLWSAAMLSTLLHNLLLSLALSVCVLYYNVSVNTGLRNALRQRSTHSQGVGEVN